MNNYTDIDSIIIENATIGYTEKIVLDGLNLKISAKGITIIFGANGVGKTTLLNSIYNSEKLLSGKILLPRKFKSISYLPQNSTCNRNFPIKVKEFVEMGGVSKLFSKKRNLNLVYESMEKMNLLNYKDHYINEVSGGYFQKTMIARMLVENSSLWLLDEPFSFLDQESKKELCSFLARYSKDKKIIMIIHSKDELEMFDAEIIKLEKNQ